MVVSKCVRVCLSSCALAGALCIPTGLLGAAIQYNVITLPQGLAAYGVDHGQVVGFGRSDAMEGATFWPTPQTPLFSGGTSFTGIAGKQIVTRNSSQLLLWNGAAFTSTDLKPAGATGAGVFATDGQQQGGSVNYGGGGAPALWSGTPGSYVDLTPLGSLADGEVTGVWNGTQVGNLGGQPAFWRGTAASYVNLTPFNVTSAAVATGLSRGQIVGYAYIPKYPHAAVWSRPTGAAFVDFNPPSATSSQLMATNGTQQVGYFTVLPGTAVMPPPDERPAVWTGAANTAQPLPMPDGYGYGVAEGIDSDGDIAGWGSSQQGGQLPMAALLWVPHRLPGDANFDGRVDFQDLMTLARHYGQSGEVGYVDGDFDMDGKVDFSDLLILARNYGATAPTATELAQLDPTFRGDVERAFADVPEPSSLALLLTSSVALSMRPHR